MPAEIPAEPGKQTNKLTRERREIHWYNFFVVNILIIIPKKKKIIIIK